jgi:hypothetical protein
MNICSLTEEKEASKLVLMKQETNFFFVPTPPHLTER